VQGQTRGSCSYELRLPKSCRASGFVQQSAQPDYRGVPREDPSPRRGSRLPSTLGGIGGGPCIIRPQARLVLAVASYRCRYWSILSPLANAGHVSGHWRKLQLRRLGVRFARQPSVHIRPSVWVSNLLALGCLASSRHIAYVHHSSSV